MRIKTERPYSSFLSAEKDLNIIINQILSNERLKRLLFYTTPDCLDKPNLTEEETVQLINRNIKTVPKLKVDESVLNYMFISFDNFTPTATNPQFRNNTVEIDILCHFDQWQLKNLQLRPYKIAAEIDTMLDNKHLTGIGTLQFSGAVEIVNNNEFGGFCLLYKAIHGGDDKRPMPESEDVERFEEEFMERQDQALK